jgi:hypothetical protein
MTDTKTIAHQSFRLIENGDVELAEQIIATGFVNEEAEDDPDDVERQLHGPAGFLATGDGCATRFLICVSNSRRPSRKETR